MTSFRKSVTVIIWQKDDDACKDRPNARVTCMYLYTRDFSLPQLSLGECECGVPESFL